MDPIVNKIKDGIHLDNAVLEQPEDTYRYARNFVIHQVANGMYKASTLKGTELYFTMSENEKPMAFTSIRNRYFLIILNDTSQIVKFYEVFDSTAGICSVNLLKQISNTYLNLSFDWPIRTIFGFYENDDLQRIYFTDYQNSPRVVNVQHIEVDDAKFAKYLSFTPVLENIYGQFLFDSINAGGNLLNGNYFIAWQYYTKDGYYSDWSPLSNPISVTPSTPGSTVDAYQDYEGAAPALNSSKSIKFRIRNIDTDYDSLRIAAFYSNDYNSAGPGIIFYDGDVSSAEMTFFLRGSENLGTLTLDELIEHTMVVEKCKSLAPVKLYNVAACLKERDELDFMPYHANNLLPVQVTTKVNELLADTTGYPTYPFTAGQKILFGVPKCVPLVGTGTGFAGIWYKATEVSVITAFEGIFPKTIQEGEYYRDTGGKFTLYSGSIIPVHKINKYDSIGISLKGKVVTTQTAQAAGAREDTIVVTGTRGIGTITINGLTKAITFSNDIQETVQTFVTDWYDDYLATGIRLSSHSYLFGGYVLVATAVTPGTDFTGATSLNATFGDLAGTVVNTVPFSPTTPKVDTITITGTQGVANITVDGQGPLPIMFEGTIANSIARWVTKYAYVFANVNITTAGSPVNQIVCTAKVSTFTTATIAHAAAGSIAGTVTRISDMILGTKQVTQIRLNGWVNGDMNVTIGSETRTLHFSYSVLSSIGRFVSDNAAMFLANESVDVTVSGSTSINITSHTAGIPNPTISVANISAVPFAMTLDINFIPNSVAVAREDNIKFSGSGGIMRVTYSTVNYDSPWMGSLVSTVAEFRNQFASTFNAINILLTVSTIDNTALRFKSIIITNDLMTFTASQAPHGDMNGSIATAAAYAGNKRKVTVTLTGTDGAAYLAVNGFTKTVFYLTSKADAALAFKNANETEYLTHNITLTNSGDNIILESTTDGLDFTTAVTITHTNVGILAGLVVHSAPNTVATARIDTITLEGVKGLADIKVSQITRTSTFDTSLAATAAQFVTDFATDYDSIGDITITSSGADIIFTGNTAGQNFDGYSSIVNKNQEGNVEELPYEGEYMDYKGPTAASRLRGYPTDEYIRLGVLFFDLKGKPFFVRWLDNTNNTTGHGDVFITRRHHIVDKENGFLSNYDLTINDATGKQYAQTNSRNMLLNISGLDITPVKDLISGFMIVRAPIVHRNLAYGNLSFISYASNDYFLNAGYFRHDTDNNKVSGVYAFVSPEDLFDFKDFIITKGDKLKNTLYLTPELKGFNIDGSGFSGLGKRDTQTFLDPPNGKIRENTYSKFYIPCVDTAAAANGKDEIMHEILYSLKYNVGDGAIGDPAGVIVDPRNVNKLFQDRVRDITADDGAFISHPGKMNIAVVDIDETDGNVKGHFNLVPTDAKMLICSIYRDNNDPYGGYGDASLANSLYMSTGHYQEINAAVLADVKKVIDEVDTYVFNNIEVYGGDTFVCLFDHKRNLFNEDASGDLKYGYSAIFPVESRMNIGLREGNHVAKNHSYSIDDPEGIRRKVNAMKLEDYNYNDGYSSDNINALYHAMPFGFINSSKFEARMRYTQPKVPGENVDKFRIFPPLNKIDLSINFGIINNIRENYSNILYWQEDQIGYIPINERQMASNAFGNAVQLGVGGIFERYDEIVTKLGNSHQFGLIDSPVGYHWYDAKRKMYLSLYKDMKLSQDSIISGLNTFFDGLPDMIFHSSPEVVDKSQDSLIYDRPGKDYGICGGYDPKNKIVFTTFFKSDNTIETTGISTLNNKFIGFSDYKSRFYFEMKNGLYSFKNNYAELHRHNTGAFLTYHGELCEGQIQIVIKDNSNLDKIFDTFDFIGNENFFNKIRYQNSTQDIEETLDLTSVEEYRYRNKRWYGTVPLIDRARVMDSYLLVTFKVTVAALVEFYQVTFNTRRML